MDNEIQMYRTNLGQYAIFQFPIVACRRHNMWAFKVGIWVAESGLST